MKYLLILPLLMLLFSCRVLTSSQLKNVSTFASASESYTAYPGIIMEKTADLHLEGRLLQLSMVTDGQTLLQRLTGERNAYLRRIQNTPSIDSSVTLVQLYSTLLMKLSSDEAVESLDTSNAALGENLSGLIAKYASPSGGTVPDDLSAKISEALQGLGGRIIKNKQARALKKIIPLADPLISDRMNNLIAVMGKQFSGPGKLQYPGLDSLIENDRLNFIQEFNSNIVEKNPSRLDYKSVHFYYDALVSFEQLQELRQQCITGARQLGDAHRQLSKSIQSRQKMKDIFLQTKDLIASVGKMKSLASSILSLKP